ncbi:MAG: hypothetical protein AB4290_18660 [Spirulina sp.]
MFLVKKFTFFLASILVIYIINLGDRDRLFLKSRTAFWGTRIGDRGDRDRFPP